MSFLFKRSKNTSGEPESESRAPDQPRAGGPDVSSHAYAPSQESATPASDYENAQAAEENKAAEEHTASDGKVTRWRAGNSTSAALSKSRSFHEAQTLQRASMAHAYQNWQRDLEHAQDSIVALETLHKTAVDLTQAHPTGAAQLFSGSAVLLSSLVREERSYRHACAQLERLHTCALQLTNVFGYVHFSLTAGQGCWKDHPDYAALLVHSAHIRFLADGDAKISVDSAMKINPQLIDSLTQAGVAAYDISTIEECVAQANSFDAVLARLVALCHEHLPEFSYEPTILLGCFNHPAAMLLNDYEKVKPLIEDSPILAAIAKNEQEPHEPHAPREPFASLPARHGEDRPPELERGVGDLDVDEQYAVETVASGRSVMIDCPPGSNRAATIVSIAADAAASGRSVMIVPANAAEGMALQKQFEDTGVGELVVNCWDYEAAPLRLRLGLRLEKPAIDREAVLDMRNDLMHVRNQLATFVNDLHRTDEEYGTSVHDQLEKLAAFTAKPQGPRTRVRFEQKNIQSIRDQGYASVRDKLIKAASMGIFTEKYAHSLWLKSEATTADKAKNILDIAHGLRENYVSKAREDSAAASGRGGLIPAQTPAQWADQVHMLEGIAQSLDTFLPQVFEQSPSDMVIATATKEWREAHGYQMKRSERKMICRQVEDLIRPGAAPKDIHAELELVQERQKIWRTYSKDGGWPLLPNGFSSIRARSTEMIDQLNRLSSAFSGTDFSSMPWNELLSALAALEEEKERLDTLPQRTELLQDLLDLGLGVFIEDMEKRHIPPESIGEEFDLACTSSIFEQLMKASPILASLGPRDIVDLLRRMRTLDSEHVASLRAPVLNAAIQEMRTFARAHKDSALSLDAMLARDDTEAFQEALSTYPRIAQLARPVWIIPAGLIAQFLPPSPWADLVILDMGADVSLPSVIPALVRGRQLVAVGDRRRLKILEESGDESADKKPESAVAAFSRVLPVIELPTTRVQLNEITTMALETHGYSGVYQPIPQNSQNRRTRLIHVDGQGMPALGGSSGVETTNAEVDAVIDAIVDHALDSPSESLAVIATNRRHARRIKDAFKKEAAGSSVLHSFVRQHKDEPFEIIDISQGSGIRRDHVILAVGYGKTVHGRVLHSFGVLATPAGFIGLVNAVESARAELTVVSALAASDLDENRISTPGPQLLADILNAASGEYTSSARGEELELMPPLLEDLSARLRDRGWITAVNFGYPGSARIPLVAGHPDIPGTWAVAVLLDDEAYVNEASLRRRDRYRIEAYESAGWKVFQTYSTSLFIDPEGQAQAISDLLQSACSAGSVEDTGRGESDNSSAQSTQHEESSQADPHVESEQTLRSKEQEPRSKAQTSHDSSQEPHKHSQASSHGKASAENVAENAGDSHTRNTGVSRTRGSRPDIVVGLPLVAYTDDALDDMLAWIISDGKVRTESELCQALRDELGIERRGEQVDRVLMNVVRRCDALPAEHSPNKVANKANKEPKDAVSKAQSKAQKNSSQKKKK